MLQGFAELLLPWIELAWAPVGNILQDVCAVLSGLSRLPPDTALAKTRLTQGVVSSGGNDDRNPPIARTTTLSKWKGLKMRETAGRSSGVITPTTLCTMMPCGLMRKVSPN